MKLQFSPPVASLTVDCVIFGFHDKKLKILLVERSSEPEAGKWALPGGFVDVNETLEQAADRVLEMMTGVNGIYMEQIGGFSDVKRHPMGRVITFGFCALVNPENFQLNPTKHASKAEWFEVPLKMDLPFDHKEIYAAGHEYLKRELKLKPIGFELLPQKFTLTDLQVLYEVIIAEKLDRRNFRRKLKGLEFLTELDEKRTGAHIGASLYKFDKKTYKRYEKEGFVFSI